MDTETCCEPWTIPQLASHALNSQLLLAAILTGQDLVPTQDTVSTVAYDGDLVPISDDAATRALGA